MAAPSAIEVELINFVEALAPSAKLTPKEAAHAVKSSRQAVMRRGQLLAGSKAGSAFSPDNGHRNQGDDMAEAANPADQKSEKRAKTGGRAAKKSLDELIANAERRGRLAVLPDDTTVEAELAAFFLIISMSQLRELRKESERPRPRLIALPFTPSPSKAGSPSANTNHPERKASKCQPKRR